MKQLKFSIILLSLSVISFSSCKKEDNSGLIKKTSSSSTSSTNIQQGSWKVTMYDDNGTIETFHFTGYSFTFISSGIATASKNSDLYNGTWATGTDDSHDKFIISFGTTSPLSKLNKDWHILENTSSKIRLEDISGGNGGTDHITFEKI